MALRSQLLHLALPLVRAHGFTREALSQAVLSLPQPHSEPLNDRAVSALFGDGENARRTLINAWLSEGKAQMQNAPSASMKDVLSHRLRYNEPVLGLLSEAFATLATPTGAHLFDPTPALEHAATIADEACVVSGDTSTGTMWYARRASLAAIYAAAELHQIASPQTAYSFLDELLRFSTSLKSSLDDSDQFVNYIGRSLAGIINSRGILL